MLFATSIGNLTGRVWIQHGTRPLPDAEVVLENSYDKITVETNEYGYYYANRIPSGKYTMKIYYNNRLFELKKVTVYDSYTTDLTVSVSNDTTLPYLNTLNKHDQRLSALESHADVRLTNSDNNQPTRSLTDALSNYPAMNVRDGKLVVKGSDQVRIFIDGTPVIGQPSLPRTW